MYQTQHSDQYKSRIAKQFSRAATQYDSLAEVQNDIAHDAMALLPIKCGTLVDIGCGTGRISRQLSTRSDRVVAMDLALGMLQHASTLDDDKAVTWLQGDAECLALADNTVDTVFSSMALQWCISPQQVMAEISRILKPQGQAVLAIMCEGSFTELEQVWAQLDTQRHINQFHSADQWQQAACQSGLQLSLTTQGYQTWHADFRSLLASIKGIGANVLMKQQTSQPLSTPPSFSRSTFAKLESHYLTLSDDNKRLPLSYQIVRLHCVK